MKMETDRLKRIANLMIYASVVLGLVLIAQLYLLKVPAFLLYSIMTGWAVYVLVAIAAATRRNKAYPAAIVLAIVTLAVSLPQPEHLSLTEAGPTLASLTFIIGSILQVGVILASSQIILNERRSAKIARQ